MSFKPLKAFSKIWTASARLCTTEMSATFSAVEETALSAALCAAGESAVATVSATLDCAATFSAPDIFAPPSGSGDSEIFSCTTAEVGLCNFS